METNVGGCESYGLEDSDYLGKVLRGNVSQPQCKDVIVTG